jgi:hypothetical protein
MDPDVLSVGVYVSLNSDWHMMAFPLSMSNFKKGSIDTQKVCIHEAILHKKTGFETGSFHMYSLSAGRWVAK